MAAFMGWGEVTFFIDPPEFQGYFVTDLPCFSYLNSTQTDVAYTAPRREDRDTAGDG